jgi:hypothetical protein
MKAFLLIVVGVELVLMFLAGQNIIPVIYGEIAFGLFIGMIVQAFIMWEVGQTIFTLPEWLQLMICGPISLMLAVMVNWGASALYDKLVGKGLTADVMFITSVVFMMLVSVMFTALSAENAHKRWPNAKKQ